VSIVEGLQHNIRLRQPLVHNHTLVKAIKHGKYALTFGWLEIASKLANTDTPGITTREQIMATAKKGNGECSVAMSQGFYGD
jgi:hypothetical protein